METHNYIVAVEGEGDPGVFPCSRLDWLFPAPHTAPSITHPALMDFPARLGGERMYQVTAMTLVSGIMSVLH